MLLLTVLYLSAVVSAIALIALILVQDRPDTAAESGAASGLRRATAWSIGLFLTSALATVVTDLGTTGSLLDHLDAPGADGMASATELPPDLTAGG